ncbi:MAG: hypothetical protein OEY09_01775 [Gammaproteobacteria bacterium]|nr:hypothetical protein [Gammaproteobacteria bacterium]
MTNQTRPDLSNQTILLLTGLVVIALIIALSPFLPGQPGSPIAQWAAATGVVALLAPILFSLLKRSGLSVNPPFWFVTHVISACIGVLFILFHAANGNWLSPPGAVMILMLFLIFQGALLRTSVSAQFSHLFARNSIASGFGKPESLDRNKLQVLIEYKQSTLARLEPCASEALFSPNLRHWITHPLLSLRYQRLISMEAEMIGARQGAGLIMAWSRRLHMLAATLFFLGLLAHVIVVLFFAGYAAGDGEIDWWYITAWGR